MTLLSRYENPNIKNRDIFILWLKLGSLDKVSLYLEKQDVLSIKTHTRYSSVTLSRYAWRYILDNPEEAYQEMIKSGTEISPEYWEQLLVRRAYAIYVNVNKNRQKFYDWLEKNDLEKYKGYKSKAEFFRKDGDISSIQEQMLTPS